MRIRYTQEMHDFLRSFIPGHSVGEIIQAVRDRFGIEMSKKAAQSYKKNHNIPSGTKNHPRPGNSWLFPAPIQEYIRENVKGVGPTEMAEKVNRELGTAYTRGQMMNYYKRAKLKSGVSGRFEKGHPSHNKGKKGMPMHPNAIRSQFKPGHKPANKLLVGTVIEKSDGYLWRKTGEGARDWRQEHILIYEAAHGPVPKGAIVTFLDGNRKNLTLDNLQMISRGVNGVLNKKGMRTGDKDLTRAAVLLTTIREKARDFRKNKGEERHENQVRQG